MSKSRRNASPYYSLEEKIALVTEIDRLYRTGGVSLIAAANAAGTSTTSYRNWVRAGIKPRPPEPEPRPRPGSPPPYDRADRERLVGEIERLRDVGQSVKAACQAVGISTKSYHKWRCDAAPLPAMVPVEFTALVPFAPPLALSLAGPMPAIAADVLTLVAPSGYRIEGLAIESAAALLRMLAC